MPSAAIFDLDRTLLPGSSATVFQQHLAAQGLLTERHIPGQDLYRRSYEWFGENPIRIRHIDWLKIELPTWLQN